MSNYDDNKRIDQLSDVSGAITSASKILCQDMDDTDRIGVVTPPDILSAGINNSVFRIPMYVDFGFLAKNSKPTVDILGVVHGYSFPIFNDDQEEIYMSRFVPLYWNGTSDLSVKMRCHLSDANLNKKFKFELCWQHLIIGDVVPLTCNSVQVEVDTGDALQYQAFELDFTIDYDADGVGNEIKTSERISARLRRVAASSDEIAGEVVVAPPELTGYRSAV